MRCFTGDTSFAQSKFQKSVDWSRLHYWGIAAALAGMGIVGASSLLSGDSGVSQVRYHPGAAAHNADCCETIH